MTYAPNHYPHFTFAQRVQDHIDEAAVIREGLAHEGPILIRALQDCDGWGSRSLRRIARDSGLSPTYMSQVMNGKSIISAGAFVELSKLFGTTAYAHAKKTRNSATV